MTTRLRIPFLVALAGLGACSGSAVDPYAAATPNVAGLALETSGSGEALSSSVIASAPALDARALTAPASCQPYEYLCNIHRTISGLNTYLHAALDPVAALASTKPTTVTADTKVFGPIDAPASPATPVATFRLTVKEENPTTFHWKLEGKPIGAADAAYVLVAGGVMMRPTSETPHRGRGTAALDLDALFSLNPTTGIPVWKGQGQLFVGFGHAGDAKSLVYVVKNFTPDRTDPAQPPVPAAALVGYKTSSGVARVRLASLNEFVSPHTAGAADAGDELLLSRASWVPGTGGRAAVLVAGGDVPSYGIDFFLGLSCFDASENEAYRALYGCSSGMCALVPNAPAGYDVGTPDLCKPGTELGVDAVSPGMGPLAELADETPEPGAPTTPEPPPLRMDDVRF